MRPVTEEAYGIPREQVIGSSVKLRYEVSDSGISLVKLPELNSFDDREVKAPNIGLHIGCRPFLAFDNSDGDLIMMRYTKSGPGPRLALLLHHDDAAREAAYDREFRLSPLSEALDRAQDYGITVVSMKRDWNVVFYPRDEGARPPVPASAPPGAANSSRAAPGDLLHVNLVHAEGPAMFIAMNRFKVVTGSEAEFERVWTERDTHLRDVPGFIEFHLLRGPQRDDHVLYASHTLWKSRAAFEAWTRSDAFRLAHASAGGKKSLYLGHPEFEGFEAIQTVKGQ